MLSDSPPERDLEWTDAGIAGSWRFINRLWRLILDNANHEIPPLPDVFRKNLREVRGQIHGAIDGVTNDLESFHFNRAVARVYELVNTLSNLQNSDPSDRWVLREGLETLVQLIGPMMPHIAEELWERLGNTTPLVETPWPKPDQELMLKETFTIAVQIKGKLKATIEVPSDVDQETAESLALSEPAVAAAIDGKTIIRIVYIPKKIINVVPR